MIIFAISSRRVIFLPSRFSDASLLIISVRLWLLGGRPPGLPLCPLVHGIDIYCSQSYDIFHNRGMTKHFKIALTLIALTIPPAWWYHSKLKWNLQQEEKAELTQMLNPVAFAAKAAGACLRREPYVTRNFCVHAFSVILVKGEIADCDLNAASLSYRSPACHHRIFRLASVAERLLHNARVKGRRIQVAAP